MCIRDRRDKEGTALILLGRYGEARERLEDAVSQIPGDPLVSHTLARLLATAPEAAVRDGCLLYTSDAADEN